jgi:FKBP-type peptidyl-prolyl cis-trans isomerase FkpA
MKNILSILSLCLFISCDKDNEQPDYVTLNETEIMEYVTQNSLNAQRSTSGLYYVIDEEGTGEQPISTSDVTVVYKGYFLNGNVFDQSDAEGVSFNLRQVISGWTEGIAYFKEGGSGMLLIPAHLAYGSNGRSGIPGGSVLIFDIDLVSIN